MDSKPDDERTDLQGNVMETTSTPTEFAPAERASKDQIASEHASVGILTTVVSVLDAMPHIVFVLNEYRQAVFANRFFYDTFNVDNANEVLGLRPGEAVDCIHATETIGGCGTTKHCRDCGAVLAILSSLEGRKDVRECRIMRKDDCQVFDLLVKAAPLVIKNKVFTIVSAVDISHEKRRRVLERVFFHDVINLAGGIEGLSRELCESLSEEDSESAYLASIINSSTCELMEQIYAQRDLAAAENNELSVKVSYIGSSELSRGIADLYRSHPMAEDRTVEFDPSSQNIDFESDTTLLKRIIGNLVKNALEASRTNETVTIGCNKQDDCVRFWVHNPAVIPKQIQRQLFQRSFSTKGEGRGIGTYTIRLLTEKYLKGSVSFTSTEERGTVFYVSLPSSLDRSNTIEWH